VELSDVRNRAIKTLSGGMKQRLALAQAMLGNPELIILDEPTAGLDPKQRISIRNYIASMALNRTIIIATHIVSDVEYIAKEIIFLKKGVITDAGTPEALLKEAEEAITDLRRHMFKVSLPLHVKYYPTHRDPVDLNLIVGEVLDKIAQKQSKPETYFRDAQRTLDEAREFLRAKADRIVALPQNDNLKIIETPAFMRGIYAVGGFNPAPPLQPELGAFYWLTPIPADWPKERVQSKLREYNYYGLRLLTIHEAIPGHWLQFEYAAQVEPAPRRLLRSLYGDGAYVEGWAVYATDLMVREGFLDHDPELELTHSKQLLRAIANAILDIRLHTMGMSDEEAMELMTKRTFQEKEEALAKLRRAKLSSCQLPTYFAGFQAWKRLRAAAEKQGGAQFNPGEFHRRALLAGALPVPAVAALLGVPLEENRTAEQGALEKK